ncbi:MAG: alpha/beta fold hydrolase [Dehalococcoidia bacterium]|nr:alpha/beta fold hydrolase [Dehalococcoidia bacterium]
MEEKRVTIRDGLFDIQYFVAGEGYPLVFLHGSGGLHRGPFIDTLAQDYRVYAPLHPGFGGSTGLENIEDIVDLALFYGDFFDAVGVERAHLVGHSLGGMLAAEIAVAQAGYVDHLVLANPIGFWRDDAPVLDYISARPRDLLKAIFHDPQGEVATAMFTPPEDPEALAAAIFDRAKSYSAAGKFAWPIPDRGLKRRIHRIKAPTLIVWGESDGLVPPVYAEDFRAGIANSSVVVLKETGHLPMYEDPPAFIAAVKGFLPAP